jgi:hypothetical protein
MDFREATDKLGAAITHDDIARQLGIGSEHQAGSDERWFARATETTG